MADPDAIADLLARSKRGRALEAAERRRVAVALASVTDGQGRVRGLPAVEVLCERPEHFEGSGRFSAIFRAVLQPDRLKPEQLEEMLLDLEVQAHLLAHEEATIAHYKKIRSAKLKEIEALRRSEVRQQVEERLRRVGFWRRRKDRYEGVALVGIDPLPEPKRGKPRRELRQEFLYGIEHPNLLCIPMGSVIEGRLVQFEEYWGYRDWRSLDLRERATVALDAARGVAHLHRLNVIHRDIKPENVLVKGRKRPRGKVCDYGLIDSDELGAHGITKTEDGTVVGTILYMAPEQARGHPSKSSDVFALGGLLYTFLTDRAPTPIPPDATRHQQSDQVLHRRVRPQDPTRLRDPQGRSADVLTRRLSLVVAACLQVRPEERYEQMADVVADLEAVLADQEPARARARPMTLRIPIDLYCSAVFSPTPPYPESEGAVVAELVEPRSRRPGRWRRWLAAALLLGALAIAGAAAADVGDARARLRVARDALVRLLPPGWR